VAGRRPCEDVRALPRCLALASRLTTFPVDSISTVYVGVRPQTPRRLAAILLAALALAPAAGASAAPLDGVVASQLSRAGGAWGGYVLDTTTGRTLAAVNADVPRVPASVNKLFTASTALLRFGTRGALRTTVLGDGLLDEAGVWHGSLYLRGGGDPTFGSRGFTRRAYGAGATMGALAVRVRAAGVRRVTGGVYGDESWFDRLRGGPTTGFALDVRELGGPLGALLYNRGLAREDGSALQTRPAKFAAQRLVEELRLRGVRVGTRRIGELPTPARALEIAAVASPPMARLARLTLVPSDNFIAEMLLKALGAQFGAGGSTGAGAGVVLRVLAPLGVQPTILDGSGLSRGDQATPRQVVTLLAAMRTVRGFRTSLAIAGRTGTLEDRMRHSSAQDRCRAKTGTLSDVSALAGFCRTPNGHLIAFAFLQNAVWPPTARVVQDRLTIRLARLRPVGQPVEPEPVDPSPSGGASASSSASSPASSSTGTPSRSAFSSLEPAASPATT
jgi:D-alanyl-D-alanine carboxypeptidase/D-alanyl-D-alanine-endopeptidase (penicillin-binding protein 4)